MRRRSNSGSKGQPHECGYTRAQFVTRADCVVTISQSPFSEFFAVHYLEKKFLPIAKIGEKREFNVSDIEEGKSVCVHGSPMKLSPIKKSRKNPDLS